MEDTKSAARLLKGAFVSMVEENELSMPAVGQLHAALGEAVLAVTVLEARLGRLRAPTERPRQVRRHMRAREPPQDKL